MKQIHLIIACFSLVLLAWLASSSGWLVDRQSATLTTQSQTTPLSQFLSAPSDSNWQMLLDSCESIPTLPYAHRMIVLNDFHEARLERDLPNSMAQSGPPDAAVHRATQKLQTDFQLLESSGGWQLRQILKAIIDRGTSEDLVWTAAELDYRLSRLDFNRDRAVLIRMQSANAGILEAVDERFAAGKGKIGDW